VRIYDHTVGAISHSDKPARHEWRTALPAAVWSERERARVELGLGPTCETPSMRGDQRRPDLPRPHRRLRRGRSASAARDSSWRHSPLHEPVASRRSCGRISMRNACEDEHSTHPMDGVGVAADGRGFSRSCFGAGSSDDVPSR
jgi:hypothetical protein